MPLRELFKKAATTTAAGLAIFLGGCASVGVHPVAGSGGAEAGSLKPKILYVSPFGFDRCALNVDREGAELDKFKTDIATVFASEVGERLANIEGGPGCNVLPLGKPPRTPQAAWWVTGNFTRINQGSRALRALVGFGSGGTKFETSVEVYDLSLDSMKPLFTFVTSGGSGAMKGGLLGIDAITMPASVALDSLAGLSDDRARTARMIAAYVSEQLAARGVIAWTGVKEAKRLDDADASAVQGDQAPSDQGQAGTSPLHAASGTKKH